MHKAPNKLLAIIGGKRAFAEPLHVGRPNIGNRRDFLARVEAMLDRNWLTNDGPLVREFETRVAEFASVRHCVAMCNATVGLEIAIRALELKGEVIIPAYTFVATAHALSWQEITPVFADMDPVTHNMDPACIERLITPRTTGIVGVHVWGRPCDTVAIKRIADRHRLKVMYDAAHAFGCTDKGRPVGQAGNCEVFSFHATKFVNSFEGGAVVTDDDTLAKRIRLMRNFGFDGYDKVIYHGTNGKMSEICAAMGLTSIEAMPKIIESNRRNHDIYRRELAELPGVSVITFDSSEKNNYQYVVVEVDPAVAPLNRDELVRVLHSENILARNYFWPGCHRMEPYLSREPEAHLRLPVTERIAARVIVLPTGLAVSPNGVEQVCEVIQAAFAAAPKVRAALNQPMGGCQG